MMVKVTFVLDRAKHKAITCPMCREAFVQLEPLDVLEELGAIYVYCPRCGLQMRVERLEKV